MILLWQNPHNKAGKKCFCEHPSACTGNIWGKRPSAWLCWRELAAQVVDEQEDHRIALVFVLLLGTI